MVVEKCGLLSLKRGPQIFITGPKPWHYIKGPTTRILIEMFYWSPSDQEIHSHR